MTPLAHFLMRQILARPKDRTGIWKIAENTERLQRHLAGIQCFEVTACRDLIAELRRADGGKLGELCASGLFLPAPKTWVEFAIPNTRGRIGILLDETGSRGVELVGEPAPGETPPSICAELFFTDYAADLCGLNHHSRVYNPNVEFEVPPLWRETQHSAAHIQERLAHDAMLAVILINSPKVVGQRQYAPHKGLTRELRRAGTGIGPLHDWHEIKLEITKPREINDGGPHQHTLTGPRALHFVRKFIRIRLGRLEYVRAHWRGDASVGIRRGRYVVTA